MKIATKTLRSAYEAFNQAFKQKIEIEEAIIPNLVKIYLLSFLPNLDARDMESNFSDKIIDQITDFLVQRGDDNLGITKIKISLDESVEKFLDANLKSPDEFLYSSFRRNESVIFDENLDLQNNILNLTISNPTIKRNLKSKDFLGDAGSILLEVPTTKFDDIAGHENAKIRLKEVANFLKNGDILSKFNATPPRGMLLYGPPGTGKTTLAKAFANYANLPFISTTGSEILDINLMKKIFKRAGEYAPAIIFIDEMDAIGKRDGSGADIVINEFLTLLNGFNNESGIFVIAATNLPQKIDAAILRSRRIDIHINIGMLDEKAREYFIDNILKTRPILGDINKEKLVKFSFGLSGADLKKVAEEASYEAMRKDLEGISEEILIEQINTLKYGEQLEIKRIDEIKQSTACHEAGHATISYLLMPNVEIEQIAVTPRKDNLGFVSYNHENSVGNLSISDLKNQICVCFAGRIAQNKFDNLIDTGALEDLKQATSIARAMVLEHGMSDIGYVNLKDTQVSEKLTQKIDECVLEILNEQKIRCEDLVEKEWAKIENLAQLLIKQDIVLQEDLAKILKN